MDFNADLLQQKLTHLPPRKRRELALVTKILFEEFELAQKDRNPKQPPEGRILKLVLYGSYARGDWVEDRVGRYFSDYDLLVVVNEEEYAKPFYWYRVDERLSEEFMMTKRLKTPVEPIVHSIFDFNKQLLMGRPFFVDVVKDGILLFDNGNHALVKPGKMPHTTRLEESQKYYKKWFSLAKAGLNNARFSFSQSEEFMDGHMRDAAFLAHQATERIYHCVMLTLKHYSPKLHNIERLRDLSEEIAPELIEVWPRNTKKARYKFDLLRRAYIEARYSPHYEIKPDELEWLFEHIAALIDKTGEICEAFIAKEKQRYNR